MLARLCISGDLFGKSYFNQLDVFAIVEARQRKANTILVFIFIFICEIPASCFSEIK